MQGLVLAILAISATGYFSVARANPPQCPFPSNELTFFPVEGNCAQYWECFQGNRWLMSCPPGLYWNHNNNHCDYIGNVDCDRNNTSTTPSPTVTTDGSTPDWTPDPQCPFPSEEIVFFPHPTDCSKYLECYRGNKYVMSCPENLYWNELENACDYLENVNCDRDSISTTQRPPTTPNSTVTPTTPDDSTPDWTPDPQCPFPSEEIVFFPHPTDCSKYLECYKGNKYVMSCPENLYWNELENACDYLENVNCDRDEITTPRPPTTPNPATTPTTPDDGTPGWTPDPQCPFPSEEIVFFPHPTDCSKYLECYRGNKYVMSCPENLYWNELENACDYLENVDCNRI